MTGQERPTASAVRIDVSAGRYGASAAPADPGRVLRPGSEAALFHGYSRVAESDETGIETRPCTCGGMVQADPYRPAPGVAAHNYTSRHKAWRANREDD